MVGDSAPAHNAGLTLAEQMIEAHGGAALWNRLQAVQVRGAYGGTSFRAKLNKVPVRATITVERARQHATLEPYTSVGQWGVFEGAEVRIESADGRVLSRRTEPRRAFRDVRHLFWWDALDLLYFFGYAMWTYLHVPFVLTDPAYELRPGGTWQEGSQTWRRLHVRFPSGIHTQAGTRSFMPMSGGGSGATTTPLSRSAPGPRRHTTTPATRTLAAWWCARASASTREELTVRHDRTPHTSGSILRTWRLWQ